MEEHSCIVVQVFNEEEVDELGDLHQRLSSVLYKRHDTAQVGNIQWSPDGLRQILFYEGNSLTGKIIRIQAADIDVNTLRHSDYVVNQY